MEATIAFTHVDRHELLFLCFMCLKSMHKYEFCVWWWWSCIMHWTQALASWEDCVMKVTWSQSAIGWSSTRNFETQGLWFPPLFFYPFPFHIYFCVDGVDTQSTNFLPALSFYTTQNFSSFHYGYCMQPVGLYFLPRSRFVCMKMNSCELMVKWVQHY